jgi:hypothetical protein
MKKNKIDATQKGKFEFQIKRGLVDGEGLDEDVQSIVDICIALCRNKNNKKAIELIYPILSFEWIWDNCDGNPEDIFLDNQIVSFDLNTENSAVKLGVDGDALLITATVYFELEIKSDIDADEIENWLDEESAYACGYIGGGWGYTGSDGDNILFLGFA